MVCLTASASRERALTAAGAVDCLRKDQPQLEEIVAAIRKAGNSHK